MQERFPAALAAGLLSLSIGTPVQADYLVKEVGSFYVGGKETALSGQPPVEIAFSPGMKPLKVDPNGEFEVGQMYVQYVKLAQPKSKIPVLMWHGGGLTGVTWETKPDGAPGWQQSFLAAGYDVYVSDSVERGRATWSRFYDSTPVFRTKKEGWELFRIGPPGSWDASPARRTAFPDTQFPTAAYDQFAKEYTPRWLTNDKLILDAYQQLVERVCPCIVIVHSQGGWFGYTTALNHPDRIRALVAVEPSAAPDPAKVEAARLRNVPILAVWGDHLATHPQWPGFVKQSETLRAAVREAGGTFDWLSLPDRDIRGNTHMLMMDRNSDQIARMVQQWLGERGL